MEQEQFYIGNAKAGYKTLYGIQWKKDLPLLQIHLACFREKMAKRIPWNYGGYTPKWFFKAIAKAIWPETAEKQGDPQFIWNSWADWMLKKACEDNFLAIAGCAGLGKSEFFAIWLLIQFLSDPANTLCMTTSMTLGASKMKMWSKIVQYWTPLEKMGMPGKLVDSIGRINYVLPDGSQPMGGLAGIALIPADRKREKDALESLIGIHPKRAIFVADDLTGLSEAVTEACFSNLSMGCEYFQFVGLANPKSYRDSFGRFAKPKTGWESINVNDLEWETERGVCIHFDATRNPRITEGDERLKWMLTQEQIDEKKRIDGEKSSSFWRMVRGFWSPEGTTEFIYTEAEIANNKGDQPPIWKDEKVKLCFLDPSFTDGGDRTIAYFGDFGKNTDNYDQFAFDEYLEFHEDVTIIKEIDRTRQLINWWKGVCFDRGVSPRHAGMDETGAGKVLLDDVHLFWSREVHGINFGASASDKPVSVSDPTPASERYGNSCTEIWYSPKEALRTGQIRGIGPDLMGEMTSRKKMESKDIKSKIFAQPKREMKLETGDSPDIGDAGLGCVELARRLFGFNTSRAANVKFKNARTAKPFKEGFGRLDSFKHSTAIPKVGQPFQMTFTKTTSKRFNFLNVHNQ